MQQYSEKMSQYLSMHKRTRLSFIRHAILQQSETRKTVSFQQDVTSLSSNFAADEFYSCASHTQSKNQGAMITQIDRSFDCLLSVDRMYYVIIGVGKIA